MNPAVPFFEPQPHGMAGCELCANAGGVLVWSDAEWRVVRVKDAAFPVFYRVISNVHIREFSDLAQPQRVRCMALVAAVEEALIRLVKPTKMNLASFGNLVAHLHWHVVARFDWDTHFPQPIWAPAMRSAPVGSEAARLLQSLERVDEGVAQAVRGVA